MTPARTLLTLPVEIRLQIWDLIFTRSPFVRHEETCELIIDPGYSSSTQLGILLTCRQIHKEIGVIPAFEKTTFVIRHLEPTPNAAIAEPLLSLPKLHIDSIRKLVLPALSMTWVENDVCRVSTLLADNLNLTELTFFLGDQSKGDAGSLYVPNFHDTVHRLRSWQNVDVVRFMRDGSSFGLRRWYLSLAGALLKEDHCDQYDALDAPHQEKTWWEWTFDHEDQVITLVAKRNRPVMSEPEYMEMVKPLIIGLTDEMEAEDEQRMRIR